MKTNLKILLLLAVIIAIAIEETSSRLRRKTRQTRFLNRFRGLKRLRNYQRYYREERGKMQTYLVVTVA